jgi:serpin B
MLPKLKLEYDILLNGILSNLGMALAFNPLQADFSNISKTDPLYISLVKQKAFLQVDEEGTEAAAVTAVTFGATSVGPSHGFFFRADRPFVLVIRDHATDTVLFIGRFMAPKN